MHGLFDNKLQQLFPHTVLRTPKLLRRHPHQLDLRKPHSDLLKFSFRDRAVKLWNALSEHIVSATSITILSNIYSYLTFVTILCLLYVIDMYLLVCGELVCSAFTYGL